MNYQQPIDEIQDKTPDSVQKTDGENSECNNGSRSREECKAKTKEILALLSGLNYHNADYVLGCAQTALKDRAILP